VTIASAASSAARRSPAAKVPRNARRLITRLPDPPAQQRRPHRQTYRRRGFFVLAFDVRLIAGFEDRGGVGSSFLTSTTTSCQQCSAGPLSNPSSRPRVAANCRSWCQASQSPRVFHVPTITRRSGVSDCRRSCPPTQPGRFFAAERRVRIAASHSGPAPSFRWTCVTRVIIEVVLLGRKSEPVFAGSLDYLASLQQERLGSVRSDSCHEVSRELSARGAGRDGTGS
jgi:hypothetical protein